MDRFIYIHESKFYVCIARLDPMASEEKEKKITSGPVSSTPVKTLKSMLPPLATGLVLFAEHLVPEAQG